MLKVNNISFQYQKKPTLTGLTFQVHKGEHLSVIGESGSGKSTLLKLIYGKYDLNAGTIFWKNEQILGPKHNLVVGYDFMKYVSQEFELEPYITVAENIGQHLSNFYPKEKQRRIQELLSIVELQAVAQTKVRYLSGGQKQRVALARAIAKQPEIILLDEPFSHIDNFKKQSLRRNLFAYLKAKNITCIVATHDNNDVLSFADNIIVIHKGQLTRHDTTQNVYYNPKTHLIASFFGEYNFIESYGIVYAHQMKIMTKARHKAIVKQSYFNGNHYLIEALFETQSIFIKHPEALKSQSTIYFEVIKTRL
ncbi:MAG: ABC transporter ATP-binding protein [Flavobacteriaceae bacterium]|nr:ABC transporter ATP-binding protein [Flavobacteriaceae bacterium]